MRPSNSGTATWVATSSGDMPSSLSCHCARELVRHSPCRIGMSSAARCATFQVSSVPPARDGGGYGPAGGQHRGDHRVGGRRADRAARGRRCAARRRTPAAAARRRPRWRRTAPRRSRCCPPAAGRGSTAPRWSGRRCRRRGAVQHAPGRGGRRRREPESGHQQRVAQERVQLAQILHAALGQIDVRLQRDARRASWNGPSARRRATAHR